MDSKSATAEGNAYAGHDIYPVHILDALGTNHVFVSWIMNFNDVLDVDKLYRSLSELLEQGDWRKLGGRLREAVSLTISSYSAFARFLCFMF